MNFSNPISAIKAAVKAVPQIKYGIGLVGLAAIFELIHRYVKDYTIAFFGIIGVIILMVILFAFTLITRITAAKVENHAKVPLLVIYYVIALSVIFFFTSYFLKWPINFRENKTKTISNKQQPNSDTAQITPSTETNVSSMVQPLVKSVIPKKLWISSEINEVVKQKIASCLNLHQGNESNSTFIVQFGYEKNFIETYLNGSMAYRAGGKVIVTVNKYQSFKMELEEISPIPATDSFHLHNQLDEEVRRIVTNNINSICTDLKKYQ